MWDQLPLDLLSLIFSFLPPHSIACCMSSCKQWRTAAVTTTATIPTHHPSWLLAVPGRAQCRSCYAYNPSRNRWRSLPLQFNLRLVTSIHSLLLCKLATSPTLRLLLCNPFTKQYSFLPRLNRSRTNPAVGVVVSDKSFRIFVAGGSSGAAYEESVEVYDSSANEWSNAGPMPAEFAVRLTVWTPNECVYASANRVLYWMTSARAYSVVGFDVESGGWREVKVPLADRLDYAALVGRADGRVGLVGGAENGEGFVWELRGGDEWSVVGVVAMRLKGGGGIKCVGDVEVVYLFRDLGCEILVGNERNGCIEWSLIEGVCCGSMPRTSVKAVLVRPSLSHFALLGKENVVDK